MQTQNISGIYVSAAEALLKDGKFDLAAQMLRQALDGAPSNGSSNGNGSKTTVSVAPTQSEGDERHTRGEAGANHPLADKVKTWAQAQEWVTSTSLQKRFTSLEGETYQTNMLLQWLEDEKVLGKGQRRKGRPVLLRVGGETVDGTEIRPKGDKRTVAELVEVTQKLFIFVKDHPGLRIEQINKELKTTTRDLALPIKKLIEGGQLRVEGQKRSTSYFPTGVEMAVSSVAVEPKAAEEEIDPAALAAVGAVVTSPPASVEKSADKPIEMAPVAAVA